MKKSYFPFYVIALFSTLGVTDSLHACCYVHNITFSQYIDVTTAQNEQYTIPTDHKVSLKKEDYPITVRYTGFDCDNSLTIKNPGCDTISGNIDITTHTTKCYPLHHVNWCL